MLATATTRTRAWPRAIVGAVIGLVASVLGLAGGSTLVYADTSFVGSDPADGAVVSEPVDTITIEFTGVSTEAGDGFVVLDPAGQLREPSSVVTEDGKVFRLTFEPALAGGVVGVRWSVRAGDAHPIDGSFSFTAGGTAAATAAGADASPAEPNNAAVTDSSDESSMSPESMATMDEFLQVDQTRPGETTATIGRLLSIGAIVLAIGFLAFAATTLRGSRAEVEGLITAVRIVGAVIVVGAAVEYLGVARLADEALASAWSSSAGGAIVMRTVAGLAIVFGLVATTSPSRTPRTARSLSAAAGTSMDDDLDSDVWSQTATGSGIDAPSASEPRMDRCRWRPDRSSLPAYVGVGLAIMSFWFDGHTVSKGFRPLHAVANSVHVLAGSVWVGGVVALAAVLWIRHRRHRPAGALELVVRFSSVASVALGAVVVAGLVMAVSILDSFGELTSTQWGQTLLLKSAAAGIAMLAGAYNHFRLMPALEASPDDAAIHDSVRATVTAEAIMLGFVVVVTAWLVAAAI